MSTQSTTEHQSFRAAWPALTGLSAVFLFEMLDNSILNVALPTIGRDLHAGATELQWITGSYAVIFGGLMLAFGALADKFGRRKTMLIGLTLLAVASFLTIFVKTPAELIAVRTLMGVAAAMTTPGSMALAFRLFADNKLRMRAISVITTVGLVGLAIGPTVGGFLLAVLPWQALLLINVPIALLAFFGIRFGIAPDAHEELHHDPIDVIGTFLGTSTIILALIAPTLFIEQGAGSHWPWTALGVAIISATLFILRERSAHHPLIDFKLVGRPLVSSGLAYQAAVGLAIAGLSYVVTLQLQLDWNWSPAHASIGMLPQVITLLATGPFIEKFVERAGMDRATWLGALCVVAGLIVFGTLGHFAYIWVAITLVLISAGMRAVGIVAGLNVMQGLPENRTSIGAALNDTSSEVASAIGIAVSGTVLAAIFVGDLTKGHWNATQSSSFHNAVLLSTTMLASVATILIVWAFIRTRKANA